MMKLTLYRYLEIHNAMLGILHVPHMPVPIHTLEDKWVGNEKMVSCIPAGTYTCKPYSSAKFPKVWEVTNVKDRSAILFHAGNTHADTHGCILLGTGVTIDGRSAALTQSLKALQSLRDHIGSGNGFTLEIVDPPVKIAYPLVSV